MLCMQFWFLLWKPSVLLRSEAALYFRPLPTYEHELVLQLYSETPFSSSFFNRKTTTTWGQKLDRHVKCARTAWQLLETHFAELLCVRLPLLPGTLKTVATDIARDLGEPLIVTLGLVHILVNDSYIKVGRPEVRILDDDVFPQLRQCLAKYGQQSMADEAR